MQLSKARVFCSKLAVYSVMQPPTPTHNLQVGHLICRQLHCQSGIRLLLLLLLSTAFWLVVIDSQRA